MTIIFPITSDNKINDAMKLDKIKIISDKNLKEIRLELRRKNKLRED